MAWCMKITNAGKGRDPSSGCRCVSDEASAGWSWADAERRTSLKILNFLSMVLLLVRILANGITRIAADLMVRRCPTGTGMIAKNVWMSIQD